MTAMHLGGFVALAFLMAAPISAGAADEPKVGDKAPEFSLKGSDGKTYTLADFKGKKAVVLAWFPKAFTPGCTTQCKNYGEKGEAALKELNVAYFTASVDDAETNAKFAKSVGATAYPILSDPDKSVAKSYGVLGANGMARRWTFYIDKDGIIREIDKQVTPANAAGQTAEKLKTLKIAG